MALIALCLWVVTAWLAMITLKARQTWIAAGFLIVTGLPIIVWLGWSMGWGWTLLGLSVVALVLRWPVIHAGRWLRRVGRRH